jgi:microcystin-dependent protein
MALPVRKGYKGAPAQAVLTNSPTSGDTSFVVDSVTGWATTFPFYCVVEPGTSKEEKVKVTAISTLTLTVVRAQDDTTASGHNAGAAIYPVFTADEADEANEIASAMTTKGDLIATNGSSINRLGVGTNTHVLQADSTATNGFKWGQVVEAGIADQAVTSAKIANSTIVLGDLAAALVTYLVPVGTINAFAGDTAPDGWLLCNGTSTSGYTALAAIVGATTPDMRGLFPIGKAATGTASTLRGTGGSTTISTSNMPSHTHTQDSHGHASASAACGGAIGEIGLQATGSGSFTLFEVATTQVNSKSGQISFAPQNATATNQNTGGGTAYYQPFIALNYIIKY